MSRSVHITILMLSFLYACLTGVHSFAENKKCTPTQQDVRGPYYLPGTPFRSDVAGPEEPGERIVIEGSVSEDDCATLISGVLIEVWQTDAGGEYHDRSEGYRLRGQFKSSSFGQYEFRTIMPGRYGIRGQFRPAHIHFRISHPGYETVVTQLYFKGDPYLWPHDSCGSYCKSNDSERIIELKKTPGDRELLEGRFDIIMNKR